MKAKVITALLLLLAAAFGFLLPDAVTALSDRRMEGQVQTLEMEPILLNLGNAAEKLKLFRSGTGWDSIVLPQGQFSTQEDVLQTVTDYLLAAGFDGEIAIQSAFSSLTGPQDGHSSFMVWRLDLLLEDAVHGYFYVDDASGLILSFSIPVCARDSETWLSAYVDHLKAVLGDTAQVKTAKISNVDYDPVYRLTIQNSQEEPVSVRMSFTGSISLNYSG